MYSAQGFLLCLIGFTYRFATSSAIPPPISGYDYSSSAVRSAAPALGTMMSNPNARVTINGQTMSGSEFKAMREKSKAKREAKARAKLEDAKAQGTMARDEM